MAFGKTLALATVMTADVTRFISGFRQAESVVGGFSKAVGKVNSETSSVSKGGGGGGMFNRMLSGIATKSMMVVSVLSTLATAASSFVAGLGAIVVSQTARIDEMLGSALQLGVAVQVFQGLDVAASRVGLGMSEMSIGLNNAHAMLNGTSQAAVETQAQLNSLGFDPSSLKGLTADQELDALGKVFKKIEDPAQRAQLAFDLFGHKWQKFLRMMDTDIVSKVQDDLKGTGLALDKLDFAKAEMFQDAWARLKAVVDGVFKKVSTALSPSFQALIELLFDAAGGAGTFGDSITLAADAFVMVMKPVLSTGEFLLGLISMWVGGIQQLAGVAAQVVADLSGNDTSQFLADAWLDAAKESMEFAEKSMERGLTGALGKEFEDKIRDIERRAEERAKRFDDGAFRGLGESEDGESGSSRKRKAPKPQEVGALIRGSTQAFKAVQESQKINDLLSVERKSEGHLEKSESHLSEIRDRIRTTSAPPAVADVPLF